jgi:HEPN domain-containing protein
MRPLAQEWIDKAEGDFRVALEQWQGTDPVWDAICFHAQQCIEKYLKAWLTEEGMDYPRTHDLEVLGKLCLPALGELSGMMDSLRFLTTYAVEIRYPGLSAGREDAQRCWQACQGARELIRARLGMGR